MRPDTATIGTPLSCASQVIGLAAQLAGAAGGVAFLEVPFVDADDEGAAFALDEIGDAQILLLERGGRVHQQDHHLGEADRFERIGDRELFELAFDPGAPPHPGGVVDEEAPAVPGERHRDGVAGDAGLGAGEQALLAEQPVDQGRLAGIGPADHGDADRPLRLRGDGRVAFGFLAAVSAASSGSAVSSGNASRRAS